MLPHDPTGKSGPKKPLPDKVRAYTLTWDQSVIKVMLLDIS